MRVLVRSAKLGWRQSASIYEVELNRELDLTNQLLPFFFNFCHFLQLLPFLDISTDLTRSVFDFVVKKRVKRGDFIVVYTSSVS